MNNKLSGPAFPVTIENHGNEALTGFSGEEVKPGLSAIYAGMTMRDYFAAKAMQGMLAAPYHPASHEHMLARDAYTVADAMLAERAK